MSPLSVSGVVGRVRSSLQRFALLAGVLWGVVAVSLVLLLAWLWAGPRGWQQGSWGPLLLDLLLLALLAGGLYAISWVRRRWLAEARVARCVEDAAGLGPGTVQGSLEISRALPRGVSRELAAFAERSLAESLGRSDGQLDAPLRRRIAGWARVGLAGLALVAPALLGAAFLTPGRTLSAWSGLSSPVHLLSVPVLPPLEVEPGDVEVPRGGAARVSVRAPGRQTVTLHWQAAGDVPRSRSATVVPGQDAGFDFPSVSSPVRYWAEAPDGARSEEYRLTPIDPLFVSDLRLEVSFPPHTGRLPEEYRGDAPVLTLPAGSRIRVDGRASRTLSEASLRLIGGQRTEVLDVGGASFSALWIPVESGSYEWYFRDTEGAPPELAPRPIEIALVSDAAPQVAFTYPAVDTILPLNLQQPVTLEVSDDYGVLGLQLVAYRISAAGERGEPKLQPIEVSGASEAIANPILDFASWDLLPGDQVRYFAQATDNAPTPQTSLTKEWTLFMPGASEMRRDAQEQLEASSELVEELARQARQLAEETRNLELEAAAQRGAPQQGGRGRGGEEPVGGFEQREDVRQTLQQQQELVSDVDSLRAELDALSEAMRDAGLADPGLRQDLEELQRLLEETATPELKERLEQMSNSLERMDQRQSQDMLREMRETQEQMRQQLEESLERFRRAAVEQDFRATTAEAEEVARLERALSEAMREGGQPELRAQQQKELSERTEQMGADMQALQERLKQIDEPKAAEAVEQGRQQSAEARSAMEQAEQQARAGQNQQASQQAQKAAGAMEQTAESLQQAREQMADQRAEALRQALGSAAEEALALARQQSEIREEMRGASPQEMSGLRGDMGAVLQGVRAMTEAVAEAMQQSGGDGDRSVSERAGQAMSSLERAIESMDPRPSSSPAPGNAAENAVDALNQLALAALQQSREAGGQQGQQSGGDMSEQLEGLAQQQGQLNNQSSQIAPMQLGQQALQRQLEELAQQQQSVAGELGKMANEPGAEQALGDLQALAMEARQLAELLEGGRLDAETRQRQERLFHRLLDAGRTLEQEDEISDERKSTTAGAVEGRDVAPLSAETVGGLRFRLPDASVLQRMTPAERQLVLEYFERLNRERPAAARPAGTPNGSPPGGAPR